MPQHGQLFRLSRAALVRLRNADKVEHERVDHFVRQVFLFVDEHAQEEGVRAYQGVKQVSAHREAESCERTGKVHLSDVNERGPEVYRGDGLLGEYGGDDDGFLEGAPGLDMKLYHRYL